jgi:hypothetical protein
MLLTGEGQWGIFVHEAAGGHAQRFVKSTIIVKNPNHENTSA